MPSSCAFQSSGIIAPVLGVVVAARPVDVGRSAARCRSARAAASSTRRPSGITSLPMPSPGIAAIFSVLPMVSFRLSLRQYADAPAAPIARVGAEAEFCREPARRLAPARSRRCRPRRSVAPELQVAPRERGVAGQRAGGLAAGDDGRDRRSIAACTSGCPGRPRWPIDAARSAGPMNTPCTPSTAQMRFEVAPARSPSRPAPAGRPRRRRRRR